MQEEATVDGVRSAPLEEIGEDGTRENPINVGSLQETDIAEVEIPSKPNPIAKGQCVTRHKTRKNGIDDRHRTSGPSPAREIFGNTEANNEVVSSRRSNRFVGSYNMENEIEDEHSMEQRLDHGDVDEGTEFPKISGRLNDELVKDDASPKPMNSFVYSVHIATPSPAQDRLVVYQVGEPALFNSQGTIARGMLANPSTVGSTTRSERIPPTPLMVWSLTRPSDLDTRPDAPKPVSDDKLEKELTRPSNFANLRYFEGPTKSRNGVPYSIFLEEENRIQWDGELKRPFYMNEQRDRVDLPYNVWAGDSFLAALLTSKVPRRYLPYCYPVDLSSANKEPFPDRKCLGVKWCPRILIEDFPDPVTGIKGPDTRIGYLKTKVLSNHNPNYDIIFFGGESWTPAMITEQMWLNFHHYFVEIKVPVRKNGHSGKHIFYTPIPVLEEPDEILRRRHQRKQHRAPVELNEPPQDHPTKQSSQRDDFFSPEDFSDDASSILRATPKLPVDVRMSLENLEADGASPGEGEKLLSDYNSLPSTQRKRRPVSEEESDGGADNGSAKRARFH